MKIEKQLRETIIKEVNEALSEILTRHGLPYTPQEICLNWLVKTDDPWFEALGILNSPGVKDALSTIKRLLNDQIEIHGAILANIEDIEALAPTEEEE